MPHPKLHVNLNAFKVIGSMSDLCEQCYLYMKACLYSQFRLLFLSLVHADVHASHQKCVYPTRIIFPGSADSQTATQVSTKAWYWRYESVYQIFELEIYSNHNINSKTNFNDFTYVSANVSFDYTPLCGYLSRHQSKSFFIRSTFHHTNRVKLNHYCEILIMNFKQ